MAIFDDTPLVERAQRGDAAAFELLVRRYERYVYNLALRVVGSPEEAEDLAQCAFVRAWKALPRFRGEAKFSTWLYRIITNLCCSRLPQLRRELAALAPDDDALDLPDENQEPESGLAAAEARARIQAAFAGLPESYRLLVSLRHLQALSYEEIAQITGLPLGTVKTGIFRARRKLREAIIDEREVDYG